MSTNFSTGKSVSSDSTFPILDMTDKAVKLLDQVEMRMFKALPQRIRPFSASRLCWEVDAPQGVVLELDRSSVPLRGGRLVTPERTRVFVLRARSFQHVRILERVTVEVDLAMCRTDHILDASHFIRSLLQSTIDNDPDVYYRDVRRRLLGRPPSGPPPGPLVDFPNGRIRFELLLKARAKAKWLGIDWAPDPSIDIEAEFRLAVSNGRIISADAEIEVNVSVPWYVKLYPGSVVWLPIVLAKGRERAREGARQAIDGIVELLNALAVLPEGRRLHTVTINTEGDRSDLQLFHCPDDPLRDLLVDAQVAGPSSSIS